MKSIWLAALTWIGVTASAMGAVIEAEVCVFGATSGGIAAAVQAARMGRSAVIVEPGRYVGGLTTGGLGATDIGNKAAVGGISREFYRRVARHYTNDAVWIHETPEQYFGRREGGQAALSVLSGPDATMWTFEPRVATEVFHRMLAEAAVTVHREQRLKRVRMRDGWIREIQCESGAVFRAKMFIDATYEGDLLAKAGVSFHLGREANATYGETLNGIRAETPHHQFIVPVDPYRKPGEPRSGLLPFIQPGDGGRPGDGDHRVQAYNYRLCFTTNQANRLPAVRPPGMSRTRFEALQQAADGRLPVTPPAKYREADFELLGRYFEALIAAGKRPELGQFWHPIWMPNQKTDINNNGGFSTDFIGRNWTYPAAGYAQRGRLDREHEDYMRGLLTYLATNLRVPTNVRREMQIWGPCQDEFPETAGWPSQLYVREGRRMVGDYVMTEEDCRALRVADDAVGLAAYNMDSHNCNRIVKNGRVENEGDVQVPPMKPYPISYRAIVPQATECRNLLVPVCLSSSHIAYGSIRMEPVFMILGQSAATAAVMAIEEEVAVQRVPYPKLRARLLADHQILAWTGR